MMFDSSDENRGNLEKSYIRTYLNILSPYNYRVKFNFVSKISNISPFKNKYFRCIYTLFILKKQMSEKCLNWKFPYPRRGLNRHIETSSFLFCHISTHSFTFLHIQTYAVTCGQGVVILYQKCQNMWNLIPKKLWK